MSPPAEAPPPLDAPSPAPTQPTYHRSLILPGPALPTTGRRTAANILRAAAPLDRGHRTSYQRAPPPPGGPHPGWPARCADSPRPRPRRIRR